MPSAAAISAIGTSTASQASDTTRDPRPRRQTRYRCIAAGRCGVTGAVLSPAGRDDLREVGQRVLEVLGAEGREANVLAQERGHLRPVVRQRDLGARAAVGEV